MVVRMKMAVLKRLSIKKTCNFEYYGIRTLVWQCPRHLEVEVETHANEMPTAEIHWVRFVPVNNSNIVWGLIRLRIENAPDALMGSNRYERSTHEQKLDAGSEQKRMATILPQGVKAGAQL